MTKSKKELKSRKLAQIRSEQWQLTSCIARNKRLEKQLQAKEEEMYKQVAGWFRFPYRKGTKPMKIPKGLGGGVLKGGKCEVCGGRLVTIRGRHPEEEDRKVCPTCAVEILESLYSNLTSRPKEETKTK